MNPPTPVFARVIALTCILMLCACGARRDRTPVEGPPELGPSGAEHWAGHALMLPAASPAVVTLRMNDTLRALDAFTVWLAAEPTMLGEEGPQRIQAIDGLREMVKQDFEVDPLNASDWERFGLDLERPIHAGLYPVRPEDEAFARAMEDKARQKLGIGPKEDLAPALGAEGASLAGLYAEASTLARTVKVVEGGRAVVYLSDEAQALATFDLAAASLGMATALTNSGEDRLKRVFYDAEDPREGLLVTLRVVDGALVVDVFTERGDVDVPLPSGDPDTVRERVKTLLDTFPFGRPRAPRPLDEPELALSLDQTGVDAWVRLGSYRKALADASVSAAAERDVVLVEQLRQACVVVETWDVGLPRISGLAYAMSMSARGAYDPERLLGVSMTLFGARGEALPQQIAPRAALAAGERALGASMSANVLYDEGWRRWLRVERPERLFETPNDERQATVNTLAMSVALPRNLGLLIANFEGLLAREDITMDDLPLLSARESLHRVGFGTTGLSLSGFLVRPQFATVLALAPSTSMSERDAFTSALRATMLAFADADGAPVVDDPDAVMTPGAWTMLEVPAGHPLEALSYYFERDGAEPFVLLGHNLDDAERERQLAIVQRTPTRVSSEQVDPDDAFYGRIEPVAAVELMSTYRPSELRWLDLNVLAQRIGATTLRVRAEERRKNPVLHVALDLMSPPRLN